MNGWSDNKLFLGFLPSSPSTRLLRWFVSTAWATSPIECVSELSSRTSIRSLNRWAFEFDRFLMAWGLWLGHLESNRPPPSFKSLLITSIQSLTISNGSRLMDVRSHFAPTNLGRTGVTSLPGLPHLKLPSFASNQDRSPSSYYRLLTEKYDAPLFTSKGDIARS